MYPLEVKETMKKLSLWKLNYFIYVMNDLETLNPNFNQDNSSNDILNDLILFLQRCRPTGRKCHLCLMEFVFQRIGCVELASEIKYLPYIGFQRASPSLS